MKAPNLEDSGAARLLDLIVEKMALKNDAALARCLGASPSTISKIRAGTFQIGPAMLIRIHDHTDIQIRKMKEMVGLRVAPLLASGNHN